MRRQLALVVFFTIAYSGIMAQSAELKSAFNQVSKTFKDYKFESEDVHTVNSGEFIIKSITAFVSNQCIVITLIDGYTWTSKEQRKQTIKVSFNDVEFAWYSNWLTIKGTNGLEYSFNGKKEIRNEYSLYATELTVKKIIEELKNLKRLVLKENFKGQLGGSTQNSHNQNDVKQKKIGDNYEQ